jgi:hydroxymethylbilane synthase
VERAALAALGGGCQVPIGIHCRQVPFEALESKGEIRLHDEVFGVVASPDTGATVRVYHRSVRDNIDPAALGLQIAAMLMEGGAGPLLAAAGDVPGGAA